ncbi:MAG TPA: hypothetical protein VEF04_17560 [Blastocatellia bacterium]|nr:hypothetical protein [Blastocatellia bacterium]
MEDVEPINQHADQLNEEAMDVLEYQEILWREADDWSASVLACQSSDDEP